MINLLKMDEKETKKINLLKMDEKEKKKSDQALEDE